MSVERVETKLKRVCDVPQTGSETPQKARYARSGVRRAVERTSGSDPSKTQASLSPKGPGRAVTRGSQNDDDSARPSREREHKPRRGQTAPIRDT